MNLFDIWIMLKIGSMVFVSSALRILIWLKGLISGMMHYITVIFEYIRPFVYATPGAENIGSPLGPIIRN